MMHEEIKEELLRAKKTERMIVVVLPDDVEITGCVCSISSETAHVNIHAIRKDDDPILVRGPFVFNLSDVIRHPVYV